MSGTVAEMSKTVAKAKSIIKLIVKVDTVVKIS